MPDDLAVEIGVREDLRVGPEPDHRAGAVGLPHRLDLGLGHATLVFLVVDLPGAVDPDLQPLAQEVDRRDTHSVEARGHLVAPTAELAAGIEPGHHELQGGQAFFLVDVDRDAPAVVVHLDAAIGEEGHDDPLGVARERLVDRVVDHFVDEVVQPGRARRTDVHARTPPHMLPAFVRA